MTGSRLQSLKLSGTLYINAAIAYAAIYSEQSFLDLANSLGRIRAAAEGQRSFQEVQPLTDVKFDATCIEQIYLSATELEKRLRRYNGVSWGSDGVTNIYHPERGDYGRLEAHRQE